MPTMLKEKLYTDDDTIYTVECREDKQISLGVGQIRGKWLEEPMIFTRWERLSADEAIALAELLLSAARDLAA